MSNQSINQIRKYVWLLRKLYEYPNGLSRKDIDDEWNKVSDKFDGSEGIPPRTLNKWIHAIEDIFRVSISNDRRGEYKYKIDFPEEIEQNSTTRWMLETISVGDMLDSVKDRVLISDKQFGLDKLRVILSAIKENKVVHIIYHDFWKEDVDEFDFEPYWVELSEQRWYVIGHRAGRNKTDVYSIDRIEDVTIYKDRTFALPKDKYGDNIQPRRHYAERSGLETDGEKNVKVRLYAEGNQQEYIRTMPLDPSQKEVERQDTYSIFEYRLPRVTYDFMKKVLAYSPYVIVLEPKSLVNEMAWRSKALYERYNG